MVSHSPCPLLTCVLKTLTCISLGFRKEHKGTRNSKCWMPSMLNLYSAIQLRKSGGVMERALSLSQESQVCGAASARNLILIFRKWRFRAHSSTFHNCPKQHETFCHSRYFSSTVGFIIIACKHINVSLLTSSLSSSNTFISLEAEIHH